MHIKQAVHLLTQQNHRLAWRTDQALRTLEDWRAGRCTSEEFHERLTDLEIRDPDDLTSDELADLGLYQQCLATIALQQR